MRHDNDKTIFKYLEPGANNILSTMSKDELMEMLRYLDKYYLEYRESLGFNKDDTFGIEIEIEHFVGGISNFAIFQRIVDDIVCNNEWITKNDVSLLYNGTDYGREVSSEILRDCPSTWDKIKKVCNASASFGVIGEKCGGHVHAGAHILGGNPLYWYRFIKLCTIYENIIYRFGYGEYLTHRSMLLTKAKPAAKLYDMMMPMLERKLNGDLFSFLTSLDVKNRSCDSLKDYGISFWHMFCDDNYDIYEDYNKITKWCTAEYRAPNGTLDYIIWQNNINFFVKLLSYCKSKNFNDDILNRRYSLVCSSFDDIWSYSEIHLEQAVELCDMIFDNNLDKLYFLRQYIKSFEAANKTLVKAKKITDI